MSVSQPSLTAQTVAAAKSRIEPLLGLATGVLGGAIQSKILSASMSHSILLGGIFGLAFSLFFARRSTTPGAGLIWGLRDFQSQARAVIMHFLVALLIGSIFGILFQRDVRGYGSSMGWGLGFGIFLWFFGPLTVFPIVGRQPLDWSAEQGTALFGSLVGYIIYGFILGTIYAFLDRIWVRLFIQSDPLNREPEGLGLHFLRSIEWGGLAGLVGGLVSIPVMAATGILPKIAGLDTSFGGVRGLVIHLLVSVGIGMTYGLLFRNEAPRIWLGVPWGFLFVLIWWYVGQLNLLTLILSGVYDRRSRATFV